MATDHERVKALFLAAIERSDAADRRAFLDAEVGDDAELRGRLDALLAAYDQPPGALDRPLAADPETTAARRRRLRLLAGSRRNRRQRPHRRSIEGQRLELDRYDRSPIVTRSARRSARGGWARSTWPSSSGRSAARWR